MRAALAALLAAVALPLLAPATASAGPAWWEPLAFTGQRVGGVEVSGGRLLVQTPAGVEESADGGATFALAPLGPAPPPAPVDSAGTVWTIGDGVVLRGPSAPDHIPVVQPDPGAPYLGAGAHLIAAPARAPGVVVAVGSDGHVWRRTAAGAWATSFIPLPAGGVSGTPAVTGLTAFTQPLTTAVYLGLDGYGVLISEDGGDDWIRADPGLPDNVLGLAADPGAQAVYAATDEGLYVHHLQAFPAPPVYTDSQLWVRWLGTSLVALVAAALAVLGLLRLLRGAPPARSR